LLKKAEEPELENLSFLQHDLLVTLAQLSKNISRKVLVFSQQSYRHLVHTMRILEMARLGLPEVRVFLEDIAVDQSDQEIRRRALLLLDYYDMRYSPVNRLMAIPKNAKFQEEVLREREQRFPRVMQEVRKDFTVFQQEQQPLLESSMFWKTLDRYEKELPPEDYARRKNLISRFEDLMFTQGEASREVEVTLLLQDDLNALFNKKPKQEEK